MWSCQVAKSEEELRKIYEEIERLRSELSALSIDEIGYVFSLDNDDPASFSYSSLHRN